jgi:uncharacterized membrane protein
MRKLMAIFSLCKRNTNRLLGVFPDWFGTDKVQTSLIVFGFILMALGVVCEIMATASTEQLGNKVTNQFILNFSTNQPVSGLSSEKNQDVPAAQEGSNSRIKYFIYKVGALVLISIGTSIAAAGIIFRVTQRKDIFQDSLEKAGVIFVGDRAAFDEVIGWDNWLKQTHRCSNLIIIGKDQIKWAEESAEAISSVLSRNIDVKFIFQGEKCNESLEKFWTELAQKDAGGKFTNWRKDQKLKLCVNTGANGDYGYYWNGERLIVKLYFEVEKKIQAPLIVFNVRFASGTFNVADFSVASRDHVPYSEKKKMLLQAGLNIWKISEGSKLVELA